MCTCKIKVTLELILIENGQNKYFISYTYRVVLLKNIINIDSK